MLISPIIFDIAKKGQTLEAEAVGVIHGQSNKGVPLNVNQVLYVPGLRVNLLSVKCLTMAGVTVTFERSVAVLKKGNIVIALETGSFPTRDNRIFSKSIRET